MSHVSIFSGDGIYFYRYNDVSYDSIDLQRLNPDSYGYSIIPDITIPVSKLIEKFTSQPVLIILNNNNNNRMYTYLFATSGPGLTLNIITLEELGNLDRYTTNLVQRIFIPNPIQFNPSPQELEVLDLTHLPSFDYRLLRRLQESENITSQTLANFNPNIIKLSSDHFTGSGMSLITFGNLPYIINQVTNFSIDPTLQQFATPGNTVVTLFIPPGLRYLIIARYDPNTGKIFPPV